MSGRTSPPGHGAEAVALTEDVATTTLAASGLLIALIFAGYYALTGDFWTAALLASCLAAAIAAVALIKAHRATLEELAALRALHKLVADNATDLVTRHDRNGVINFASPAAEALLGVSPSLLVRRGLAAAMNAGNAARCQDAIAQCLEFGAPVSAEIEITVGAAPRWIEFRCKPLAGGSGAVCVMRDVTARRWHAIAMRQAREEAESASRAKSAFIATISHELRTPLNAIMGFSEMLHRDLSINEGSARQADYSRIIRESGEHLMSLVKDLLDISKIEAGRLTICTEPFHAPDVIASSVDTLRPAIAAKSIALDVSIADDLGEMNADKRALKQMLMNLLSNACKFTPEGGCIELAGTIEAGNVLLAVRDNGIGIPPEHIAKLGEPFYQVDSSLARQLEGAGLGLAIVRGLADLHGGRLEIESTPGVGSCFRLLLPLDAEAHVADQQTDEENSQVRELPAEEAAPAPPIALVA
jgi:cell cycle sensor histidine kinase DivJ